MLNDKIIKVANGRDYYILEEVVYNGKKYIMATECDLEKDILNEEKYIVMELKLDNSELIIDNIDDIELAKIVTGLLIEKIRNSN